LCSGSSLVLSASIAYSRDSVRVCDIDLVSNPYTPGAGAQPTAFVGRGRELEAFDAIIQRAQQHLRSRGLVLSGLRGVGKTVLLNELYAQAQRAGWLAVKIEA
jgi:Cdc6-like AAA superfamily ATPase